MMKLHASIAKETEYAYVSHFIKSVFDKHVAPHYTEEGCNVFYQLITPQSLLDHKNNGAITVKFELSDVIYGVSQLRDNHIVLFFVDDRYQNQRVGTFMIDWIKKEMRDTHDYKTLTVNAAPNSIDFYKKSGFNTTDDTQIKNGITFTPMQIDL